jgi:hypothetical protein
LILHLQQYFIILIKKKKNYKTFIDNKNVDIKFSVHDVFLE